MKSLNNVVIRHYRKRRLVGVQEVHNLWTVAGRTWLAEMLPYASLAPDTPERTERLKYFGVGIGSTTGGVSVSAAVAATYPAGADPNATGGNEYNKENPTAPAIGTLELPVKKSGMTTAYPGDPADVWLFGPSDGVFFTHKDITSVTIHAPLDTSGGDITGVFAPAEIINLTEAGLFLDTADINAPYNSVMGYISFNDIALDDDTQVEFIWTVRFIES